MAAKRRQKSNPRTEAVERTAASPDRQIWLFICVLIGIALWAYSTSFGGALIGDDDAAIAQNTTIRSLTPISGPLSPPKDTTLAGRPIANLTFAVNYAIASGTQDLWGYHAVNFVIHLLAGLTLFGVVRRSLLTAPLRDRFGPAAAPLAFAVAAIWIAHPLHTQAVTFLAQRVESLMGLLYLATVYFAIRAAESGFTNRTWIVASIAVCALGMGTKETMITAPLIVLLWIWILRPGERLLGPPRTLLAGLAATMVIVLILAAGEARAGSAGFGVKGWTWWLYLRTQAGVIVHYLRLAFWPRPLIFQYGWLPAGSWGEVLPQMVLLAGLAAGTLVALVRRRPVALLGAWFFLILAPSSSILPIATEVAAEHRMYLPLAAVVSAVVLGVFAVWVAIGGRMSGRSALRPPVVTAWMALAAVVVPLAQATNTRNRVYESPERMAADVAANRPQNAQSQLSYGMYLVGQRRFAQAEEHLRMAISLPLPPSTDEATSRSLGELFLGLALASQQKIDEAGMHLQQAITLRPDMDRAYPPLAEAQLSLKQPGEAVATLERAIARRPDDASLLKRVAWVLATSSDPSVRNGRRAVEHAEHAVEVTQGADPVALDTLAAAYAESGAFDRATATIRRAIDIVPTAQAGGFGAALRNHLSLFESRQPLRTQEW